MEESALPLYQSLYSGIYNKLQYYAGTAQYEFGFGLSLTNFTISSELEGTAMLGSSQPTT